MSGQMCTRVIGLGSDFGDDCVGRIVIERLHARSNQYDAQFYRSPLRLLDCLEGVDVLHVVDACQGAGRPGTILRRNWPCDDLATIRFLGTHDGDLLTALCLAEGLMGLPDRVTLWGIEIESHGVGPQFCASLSPVAEVAAEEVASRIVAELEDPRSMTPEPSTDQNARFVDSTPNILGGESCRPNR